MSTAACWAATKASSATPSASGAASASPPGRRSSWSALTRRMPGSWSAPARRWRRGALRCAASTGWATAHLAKLRGAVCRCMRGSAQRVPPPPPRWSSGTGLPSCSLPATKWASRRARPASSMTRKARERASSAAASSPRGSRLPSAPTRPDPPDHSKQRAHQRPPLEQAGKVGEHHVAHCPSRLHGGAALVRLQHDIVHRQERLRHVRLVDENVERRTAEPPLLQGGDEGLLVHDRTARHVDKNALRAERVHGAPVDELFGVAAARHDDDQRGAVAGERLQVR